MVCKFWLRPVAISHNDGFPANELNRIRRTIETNLDQIIEAWHEHCAADST